MLNVSTDQNTHIQVNGRITDHGKHSFEIVLELDGSENVFSNRAVNACRYRTVSLMNHIHSVLKNLSLSLVMQPTKIKQDKLTYHQSLS